MSLTTVVGSEIVAGHMYHTPSQELLSKFSLGVSGTYYWWGEV